MKKFIILPIFIATFFVSCNSDDDSTPDVLVIPVEAPADYTFTRNNQSTVSFSGQTTRILMAEEIVSAFKDVDNATQSSIQAMFDHQEGAVDFEDTFLNESGKSVRSKVAASTDFFSSNATEATAIKAQFDTYITSQTQEVFPNWNSVASAGVAGQIADGSSTRYISSKGLEYNQAFAKGLIGGLMTDQIINNYLSTSVLDAESNVENNNNDVLDGDKPYTTMEHKWDEGYGYLFGAAADVVNPVPAIGEADNFLNKYVGRVEGDTDFTGITQEIFDAFKLGRAAIVAKNYEVRNAQAAILQQKISEVIAIRSIYYLQNGKIALGNNDFGGAFHDLSEGYGFLTSLRFTRDIQSGTALFTKSEVDGFIADLMNDGANGFWDVTPATLDAISETIAAKFSFTVAQAASAN
ncbi:MAG: hypothetical protein ACI849_001266 [Patiriisocius sp.]|jgi:hypothetical protein